ncbi:hypothetical protein HT585_15930 [Ensifer sp. HO-A22]|jgi:hypothetical protein|uniref:Transmembrane protein n=1 Tax=Ensifer oleiphilus TaxID=2742698 RepID=A0A7Y6Q785_9HYPH|nr:hypothetical protein [Ensifer oleiphilus]NVD40358.1 hypothetical protein [Ensifer oleiphilus]
MRRMLSGLSVIAVLAFAIGTGGMHPAASQNKPQDRSTRNPEEAGKPSATPARSKSPAVVVNHPPPRNGAYYKGIFRN